MKIVATELPLGAAVATELVLHAVTISRTLDFELVSAMELGLEVGGHFQNNPGDSYLRGCVEKNQHCSSKK